MNTPSNAVPDSPLNWQPSAPAVLRATRPVYWSIRREFWENRYLYIAPLAVAAVFLFGFLISSIHSPGQLRASWRSTLRTTTKKSRGHSISRQLF